MRTSAWSKIVVLADPFGHGLCLIEFQLGYWRKIDFSCPSEKVLLL